LIDSCGFPEDVRARMLHGTALEWLGLPAARFGESRTSGSNGPAVKRGA
jgi:hypothetical protein